MQTFLIIWFSLTAVSVLYVAYDLFTSTPEMKVMKWGWIMVTLYTGILGLGVYVLSCKATTDRHEKFVAPLWKQTVGSTIHCLAGDATGVIVVAFITSLLNLPMGLDSILEYIAGFSFGLFVFQALFMKDMLGGSYKEAVKKTWYAEWLSMNMVMAGMIPVMNILMTADMRNMHPTSLRFWGIMSLATLSGALLAIPINWWLVKTKQKHGMGTQKALGQGGAVTMALPEEYSAMNMVNMNNMDNPSVHKQQVASPQGERMEMHSTVSSSKKTVMAIITVIWLALGVLVAFRFGDFSMRPKDNEPRMDMNMDM